MEAESVGGDSSSYITREAESAHLTSSVETTPGQRKVKGGKCFFFCGQETAAEVQEVKHKKKKSKCSLT